MVSIRHFVGLVACVAAPAMAAPVTFEFDLPNWTFASSSSVFGSAARLDVTLDNGSNSLTSQVYKNSQVQQILVTAIGGSYSHLFTGPFIAQPTGNESFFSTDAAGQAILDLLAAPAGSDTLFASDSLSSSMQLARPSPMNGATPFKIHADPDWAYVQPLAADGASMGFRVNGKVVPAGATVPEPAGLGLFGVAMLAAIVGRRRAAKR